MEIPTTAEEFLVTLGRAVIAQKSPPGALRATDRQCVEAAKSWSVAHQQGLKALRNLVGRSGGDESKGIATFVDDLKRNRDGINTFLKVAPPYLSDVLMAGIIQLSGDARERFIDLFLDLLRKIIS